VKKTRLCGCFSCFLLLGLLFCSPFNSYSTSFVVVGDTQGGGVKPSPVAYQIMKEVSLLSPDFVIITGDWTDGPSRESWTNFLSMMKDGNIPYHLTIGNHCVTKSWDKWCKLHQELIKGPLYYSFEHENNLFIVLCCFSNENGNTVEGKIDSTQFAWLEEELNKSAKFKHVFIFVHEPLYPVTRQHTGSSLDKHPEERDKLAELLKRHKDKLIVFCGHEHLFNEQVVDGVTQIISGGGGGPLYASPEKGGFYHYLYCQAEDDVKVRVIQAGSIYDTNVLKTPYFLHKNQKEGLLGLLPVYSLDDRQITIDAELSDWGKLAPYVLCNERVPADDFCANLYLRWSEKGLYFAAKVKDKVHMNNNTGKNIWNGDAIQLAFDPLGNATPGHYGSNDYEFGMAMTSSGQQCYCWQAPKKEKLGLRTDIQSAIKRDGEFTIYEGFFPAAELAPIVLKPDHVWGFNALFLNDDNGQGATNYIELSPGLLYGKNPSLFRKLILIDQNRN